MSAVQVCEKMGSETNPSSEENSAARAKTGPTTQTMFAPFLDEDALSSTSGGNANYMESSPSFIQGSAPMLYDVTRATNIPTTMPMASRSLKLESLDGLSVTEPTDSMALLLLQQHHQQQQQALAVQLEQDYLQTRGMLQHCSHNVLLSVLLSLLDDYPTQLVTTVRARVEAVLTSRMTAVAQAAAVSNQAAAAMMANSPMARTPNARRGSTAKAVATPSSSAAGAGGIGVNFVPNSAAAPWTPTLQNGALHSIHAMHHINPVNNNSNNSNNNYITNVATSPSSSSSYQHSSTSNRRTRNGGGAGGHRARGEEQEMCSLHHCMRALKHLQLNASTNQHECVPGFHCLVDTPMASAASHAKSTLSAKETAGYTNNNINNNITTNATSTSTGAADGESQSNGSLAVPANLATKLIDVDAMLIHQQLHSQQQRQQEQQQQPTMLIGTLAHKLQVNGNALQSPQSHREVSVEARSEQQQQQQPVPESLTALKSSSTHMYNQVHTFSQVHDPPDEEDDVKLDYNNLMNLLQSVRDLDKE